MPADLKDCLVMGENVDQHLQNMRKEKRKSNMKDTLMYLSKLLPNFLRVSIYSTNPEDLNPTKFLQNTSKL